MLPVKKVLPHVKRQYICLFIFLNVFVSVQAERFLKTPFLFFLCMFIVVQVQLSPFSPHCSSPPQTSPRPPLILSPLALSMCPLYMFLDGPSPIFSHYPSPLPPLVIVSLFFISMPLVLFCLLICFVD